MFNKKILFAVLIVAVLSATVGSVVGGQDAPNTVYVSPSGNDGNTGTSNAPFKTIKKAVEAAPNGGTVFIKSGLYYAKDGNSNIIIDKDLNIVGEDKETTTIDCSDVRSTNNGNGLVNSYIFKSHPGTTGNNQTLKVKNLTFQNQEPDAYVTIWITSSSNDCAVENCDFINNQGINCIYAYNYGKGSLTNFDIKVLNCSFTNNSMRGGVLDLANSGDHYSTVAGCNFVNNRYSVNYGQYAAISLGYDSLVSDSYFEGNTGTKANDIYHSTGYGTIKLHNNTCIQPNGSISSTPSIFNEYGSTVEI